MKKHLIFIVFIASWIMQPAMVLAQTKHHEKGYNYDAHARTNKKAAKWSKHRMKASKGDQLNVKCTARQSRRYARKGK